ncbi:hypothetical protein IYX23_06760 [Methylocystis sp. L43]|uniref:hypothetical protein n=1 Tax=unclassified Methylocystis TaxID=2625913 RepID=UPI0018C1EE52|nr:MULTISPECIES: hypothetical protein [unclassified Methylocystis]MBG0797374.1 hypothetical protein [Methylocystis sp. L43]MBG0807773.1 hypothetical protein [Methylocystis sp. H15]
MWFVSKTLSGAYIGGGRRVPFGEDDLVLLIDDAVIIGVEGEHRVAGAGPGGAMLIAVARRVEEGVRRTQRIDFDSVAIEVEDDGPVLVPIEIIPIIIPKFQSDFHCHEIASKLVPPKPKPKSPKPPKSEKPKSKSDKTASNPAAISSNTLNI